jgi:co-chaperonin GroES (HSP10)
LDVRVGDRVIFSKYSGSPLVVDQRDFVFVSEDQILGVLEENGSK